MDTKPRVIKKHSCATKTCGSIAYARIVISVILTALIVFITSLFYIQFAVTPVLNDGQCNVIGLQSNQTTNQCIFQLTNLAYITVNNSCDLFNTTALLADKMAIPCSISDDGQVIPKIGVIISTSYVVDSSAEDARWAHNNEVLKAMLASFGVMIVSIFFFIPHLNCRTRLPPNFLINSVLPNRAKKVYFDLKQLKNSKFNTDVAKVMNVIFGEEGAPLRFKALVKDGVIAVSLKRTSHFPINVLKSAFDEVRIRFHNDDVCSVDLVINAGLDYVVNHDDIQWQLLLTKTHATRQSPKPMEIDLVSTDHRVIF